MGCQPSQLLIEDGNGGKAVTRGTTWTTTASTRTTQSTTAPSRARPNLPVGAGSLRSLISSRRPDSKQPSEQTLLDGEGFPTPEEIAKRTVSSPTVSVVTVGEPSKAGTNQFRIRYAYGTQRGFYPDGMSLIRVAKKRRRRIIANAIMWPSFVHGIS